MYLMYISWEYHVFSVHVYIQLCTRIKKCVMYKYDVYIYTLYSIDTATLGKVSAQSETINFSVSNEHQGYPMVHNKILTVSVDNKTTL